MAMSAAGVQSLLANPMTGFSSKARLNQLVTVKYARNTTVRVQCTAEDKENVQKVDASTTPITTPPPPPPPQTPQPKRTPKVSTNFSSIFAFRGPAPERINGRLAMIGFVAAMGVELSKGQDVFSQISDGGVPWFLATSVVLSLASVIPLFKGVSVESKYSGGLMNANAELWNGRVAMLGLVALALTEFVKGGALV